MINSIDALNWRYATKQFDAEKKLSQEQVDLITDALRLTPSSFGLQPWKFLVISNPELRTQLRAASWDQPQITDASHLIVFARRKTIDHTFIEQHLEHVARTRGITVDQLEGYANMLKGFIDGKTQEQLAVWASKQVYIALGNFLTTAAIEKIDTCPMEGFDPAQYDTILKLEEKDLATVVIAAVGMRSTQDSASQQKKVRFPKEEVIIEVS